MGAIISESAYLGKNVQLGAHCIIEDNVIIGDYCQIGHNVIIRSNVTIGCEVQIADQTIIGKLPVYSPRSIFQGESTWTRTIIGDYCRIGAQVVIYIQCEMSTNNFVADYASIRENVVIGEMNIIGRNATIENHVQIGNFNKIETNVYLTAYSIVTDYCFIAPCVSTSNDNFVGRDQARFQHFKGITMETGARVGVSSIVLPGIVLGRDCLIGAGSLVTKNVPEGEIWLGSPAKYYGLVSENQRLANNIFPKH